jgi:methylated-DNA-[protein]-cysteine S-methyltransferase
VKNSGTSWLMKSKTVRTHLDSPLGRLTLVATPKGLAGLWFPDDRHGPCPLWLKTLPKAPNHPLFIRAALQLEAYFGGRLRAFDVPLDLTSGTPFQQAVWQGLQAIPFGEIWNYSTLAADIGKPKAVRAVGGALGKNPISVIVPCHRVCGASGALTGFAAGLDRKAALLALEATAAPPRP